MGGLVVKSEVVQLVILNHLLVKILKQTLILIKMVV